MKKLILLIIIFSVISALTDTAYSNPITFNYSDSSGLSATAEFSVSNGQLVIVLTNTSTGVPQGFSNSDQLLTSVAFCFGSNIFIGGGTAIISQGSYSINFDLPQQLTGGADVSTEWGYGNWGSTGFENHDRYITTNKSGSVPFQTIQPGVNLDGPNNIDGPQGGLTNGIVPMGGYGAIYNSLTTYLNLIGIDLNIPSNADNLLFNIASHGVVFEFGSDAAFAHGELSQPVVPEPSTILMLLLGIILVSIWNLQKKFY